MAGERDYFVYILSSQARTLYVGVTSSIRRRLQQHRNKAVDGFTSKYNISQLVYLERYGDIYRAIEREKQIKKWRREKKIALILQSNPDWHDLSDTLL